MKPKERKERKQKSTRKIINFLIRLCTLLDNEEEFPGVEYNLTVMTEQFNKRIADIYTEVGDYSSLVTLRVTQHINGKRLGPLYCCVVGKKDIWTFEAIDVQLWNGVNSILSTYSFRTLSSLNLANYEARVIKDSLLTMYEE